MQKRCFFASAFLFCGAIFALTISAFSPADVLGADSCFDAAKMTPEGLKQLESDWLFQCDNQPTFEKAKQEITWTREAAERLVNMDDELDFSAELAELEAVEKKIAETAETEESAKELYFAVRRIKRTILFANPLIDFDKVLLIDNPYPNGKPGDATNEWGHEARHRNGYMGMPGGRLLIAGLNPGSEIKDVLEGHSGSFWRPDLSYDTSKIVFSFEKEGEKSFHLYEVNSDGTGLKQLTFGDYDDLDPIYTPDEHIVFCTTRQHSYVRCMPMTHSFAVARCDADGKNIYVISANGEPEYLPSMLNDGRLIFTRWEYTDKALWRVQSLWTMNPNGTNIQTFWGNQSTWPDVLTEARAIPNSRKVMFTGVGHHAWFNGSIGIINPDKGLNYPDGLTRVTRDVAWAEVGNGPNDPAPEVDYHAAGKFYAYKTPFPLSEEYFMVSARDGDHLYNGPHNDWYFNLYFMDIYGNRELIYEGNYNAYHAIPFREREVQPVYPDNVEWPVIGSTEKPAPVTLYSNNVFDNAPEILKEKGKAIRVIQMDPKTYTTWNKTVQHDGPAISIFQADGVKRILGTVPIEEDGSIKLKIPAGEAVFFEMLDAEGRAIHVMRSFASGMPGEVRGCFGCHESNLATRGNQQAAGSPMGIAMQKSGDLIPPPWGAEESIGYKRFVQTPVLDKYCAKCHQDPENDAYKALNMTFRPSTHGWWANVQSRPEDISPFAEPYYTMVSGACGWGGNKPRDERGVPKNIAGLFIVEGYDANDPANLVTLPPYSAYSPVSQLVHNAMSGEHHDVKVEGEDLQRLIAWVDCNGPYLGDEEIRDMYDPQSFAVENIPPIRPRIATAPRINRFNLRQDGDTKAMLGEFKLLKEIDTADPNAKVNAYRQGVQLEELESLKNEKVDIEIVAANYGDEVEADRADVSKKIKELFNGSRYIPVGKYNDAFGDPKINVVKTLRIAYKINGSEIRHISFNENDLVILPKE